MKRILVWFRNDLRLHDQPALSAACADAEEVIAFYCFEDYLYEETPWGFKRSGAKRAQFILEALTDLEKSLATLNIPLVISQGNSLSGIQSLDEEYGIDAIYFNSEYALEEIEQAQSLEKLEIPMREFSANQLYTIDSLPFPLYKLPKGFTSFRKKVENITTVDEPLPKPHLPKGKSNIKSSAIPSLNDLGLNYEAIDERKAIFVKGGESAALERVEYYLFTSQRIAKYKETRNELIGADYSSKFSFWLAQGSLSPRFVFAEIKRFEKEHLANESTYWLFFELLWREFFRLNAAAKGARFFQMPRKLKIEAAGKFEKWRLGKTGEKFVDANMKELLLTGFMSNRGRQNVASYLINNMKLDWQLGAAWFESALIDYDVYSNYGNWTYLAGNGNDPRGQRQFNVRGQAERYDPEGSFVSLWLNQ